MCYGVDGCIDWILLMLVKNLICVVFGGFDLICLMVISLCLDYGFDEFVVVLYVGSVFVVDIGIVGFFDILFCW